MSFTHDGNRGTTSDKTSGTTLALSPTADINAGQVLVVWVACDARAQANERADVKCEDDAGNEYVLLYSYDGSEAGTKPSALLFLSNLANDLLMSNTVTVTWLAPITAKAMSVHEFSITADVAIRYLFASAVARDNAVDPSTLTGSSSMRSQQYLMLHCLAAEGPNTDAYTWDANYTQITGDGTTGGADDSNIHLRGGFRILTTSSAQSVNVTSDTADRDYVQLLTGLVEANIPTFPPPGLGVLDDGNRADENPLSFGGMWSDMGQEQDAPPGGDANAELKLASGKIQVADQTHIDNYDVYYWKDPITCNECAVWATLDTVPSTTSTPQPAPDPPTNQGDRGVRVLTKRIGVSGDWSMAWQRESRNAPDGYPYWPDHIQMGGYFVYGHIRHFTDQVAGHKIGMSKDAYHLHFWRDVGSGWEWLAGMDVNLLDPQTSSGPFLLGLRVTGSETRVTNFGGGHTCFTPGFYRRR